ncbi:MAG TPA: AAA family ATPase [Candidatus Jeotgalibaca merdavium]|uniref:AAA family ATPase n=2 Tax=Jeotgalibaca TaxID=1470540 RepID=A0A6G7K7U2_9LACT|nr:UvrD-helicase domain-containing protein [Jeotgalibaca arthritidis]QII81339.1 AAA family ATPase [Jeotgalibaca arthritidis]HJA90909.1 AAA family ATPase [Candidatus Jeotgalibaca merdavium]
MVENESIELNKEQSRMDYVVSVIEKENNRLSYEYTEKLERQKELLKESSSIKINNSSNEAMWESSGELREFEQNLTIKSNELNQVQNRRAVLTKMQEDPYFGRIDYHNIEENEEEQIYVGIGSLFDEGDNLIVDWRAPISALYYEGNVGDTVKLRFGEHSEAFQVDLKRQFRVKNGHITGMIDTDNVMGDPYLLEVLESSSSNQMGPVIATLQKEQNRIVRESTSKNVLIQGVAGSGKTVVMMQKIAYMLYAYRNFLKAEDILLFSPNRIFQAYISQVLPSLGEWDVEGNTFSQFMTRRLPSFDLLSADVGGAAPFNAVKGSLEAYEAMQKYGRLLKKKHLRFRDILLNDEVLISKEEIEFYYNTIESKGSLAAKLEILRVQLLQKLEILKEEAVNADWVDEELQHLSESSMHQFERKTHDITRMESYIRKEIVAKAFRVVEKKINNQSHIRFLAQYIHFLRVLPQLVDLSSFGVTKEEWEEHVKQVVETLRDKEMSIEDMTAYYALLLQMKGIMQQKSYQYICIDEIQDITPFQLKLLKELYPRAKYVMAGDLNQNIWQNRLSEQELSAIFAEEAIESHLLLTSYRSTAEIMAFADQFASLSERKAKPIRSREKPTVFYADEDDFSEELRERISGRLARGERVALLAPTVKAAQQFEAVVQNWELDFQTIYDEDDFLSKSLILMPISLAKGLEFDVAVGIGTADSLADLSKESYHQIWYTIFSRAMHELYVVVSNDQSPLLDGIDESTYQVN